MKTRKVVRRQTISKNKFLSHKTERNKINPFQNFDFGWVLAAYRFNENITISLTCVQFIPVDKWQSQFRNNSIKHEFIWIKISTNNENWKAIWSNERDESTNSK